MGKKHKKSEHMDDTIHYETDAFYLLCDMQELKQTPLFAPCGHIIAEPFYCPYADVDKATVKDEE